jgi:hypothetical protein
MSDDILEMKLSKEELEELIKDLPQILKDLEQTAMENILIENKDNSLA